MTLRRKWRMSTVRFYIWELWQIPCKITGHQAKWIMIDADGGDFVCTRCDRWLD